MPAVIRIQVSKFVHKRLGTLPDTELSRQTGYSEDVLRRCREDLCIARFSRVIVLKNNRHALAIIKTASVRSAARKLCVSRTTIQKVRDELGHGPAPRPAPPRTVIFPKALIRQLGKTYDSVLAQHYGVPRTTVRLERQRRGIPAMPNNKGRNRVELPAHIFKRLGKDSDRRLAKECGRCYQTISQRRNALGIPRYRAGKES